MDNQEIREYVIGKLKTIIDNTSPGTPIHIDAIKELHSVMLSNFAVGSVNG